MEETIIFNSNMHFEHQQWKGELAFWGEELKFFNDRLDELINRKENKNILPKLEHFQNEFMHHLEIMETMYKEIEEHETQIEAQNKENIIEFDNHTMKMHGDFRKKFEQQRLVYSNLKKGFFRYM